MNKHYWIAALLIGAIFAAGPAPAASTSADAKAQAALINTQLGITYMRQGDLQAARDKIEKALGQNPHTALTQQAAGFLYDRLGDDKKAKAHFQQAVKLGKDDPDVINNAAVYFCRKGERKLGEKYFLQAAGSALYKTPEIAYTNAGQCARSDGRIEDAEQYFRTALKIKPDQADALLQLADMLQSAGRSAQAEPFLQRHLAVAPATSSALWLGYRIEHSLGNNDEAEEYARRIKMEFASSAETRDLIEAERSAQ